MKYWLSFIVGTLRGRTIYRQLFDYHVQKHCRGLQGKIVDFAGGGSPSYYQYLNAESPVIRTNRAAGPDIDQVVDLTQRLPFEDSSVDHALFFNASYIIKDHEQLWSEFRRILTANGCLYIAAPFVANEMPDPHDFGRLSHEGFVIELQAAGFTTINVYRFGGRAAVAIYALHPLFLHGLIRLPLYGLALIIDWLLTQLAPSMQPLPLGYFIVVKR